MLSEWRTITSLAFLIPLYTFNLNTSADATNTSTAANSSALICTKDLPYLSANKTTCVEKCSFLVSSTEPYTDPATNQEYDRCKDGKINLTYSILAVIAIVILFIILLAIVAICDRLFGGCLLPMNRD